ncbi:YbaY family lipoprotein [Sphingomonas sp. DT-207]|uniref:YbaY family lipoprotein n=1 Tax=Sphingomonas sp. DT-207 TaxID=3396167 RepID=UPI003F1DACC8
MQNGGSPTLPPGLAAGKLSGTVTYRQRIALPPDAVVEVSIVDVAKMDAPSRTIGSVRVPTRARQVPIPFELRYAADRSSGPAEYAVQARIEDGRGRLLFITDTRNPLPAGGRIELVVVPAGG